RTQLWTYDRVGNRLTQSAQIGTDAPTVTSYSYDANDRLLSESGAGAISYGYDANGNTTSKSTAGELVEYDYDDANRLVTVRQGSDRTEYRYDADGLRVAQLSFPASGTPTTTYYLQDTNRAYAQVIEEFSQSGSATPQLAAVFAFADDLLSQTRAGVTRF